MSSRLADLEFFETQIKMPLMILPVRSVAVSLSNAKLLLSPGSRLTDDHFTKMGSITDLVAPNLYHAAGIKKAHSHFSQTKVWGSLPLQRKEHQLAWTHALDEKSWPYNDELKLIDLEGMPKVRESCFIHRKSKSLIITDLAFNMKGQESVGSKIILGAFGTLNKFATSRFFALFISDRNAFTKSIQRIFAEDFENVIVSHGENIFGNGKAQLEAALKLRGL